MVDEPFPDFKNLNFSQFHPLDHSLWNCRHHPGGRRRHLQMSWEFLWCDRVYAVTLCRLGRHDPAKMTWYAHGAPARSQMCCRHCYAELSLTWRER